MRFLPPFLVLALLALMPVPGASQASITHALTDQPGKDGEPGHWQVEVEVSGLRPGGGVLRFEGEGSAWPRGGTIFEVLESEPPVWSQARDGSSMTLRQPDGWDGQAHLVYRVKLLRRGSDEQRRFRFAPSRGGGFAYGNSCQVLMKPNQAFEPFEADVVVEIVAASEDGELVTGWGGRATGRQRVMPDTLLGHSPVVFGAPTATTLADDGASFVECFQFCTPDATPYAAEIVLALGPAMERATGLPARSPWRVFLSDAMAGGLRGDYGLHVGVPGDAAPGHERSSWFVRTLGHELFHEWLGVRLYGSGADLTWFVEGFTSYFALWFAAAGGITSHEHFAETLEAEDRFARNDTSLGRVPLAHRGVNWHDGDEGPNQLLAYHGVPVLALALDVELRTAGRPGLLQLVRDLLARDELAVSPEDLRAWFADNGLAERWDASTDGCEVPAAGDSLVRAGFLPIDVPVDVAYLGLQTVGEEPSCRVLAVDPDGPAAAAGVLAGDVVDGVFPSHDTPTRLAELSTLYTFGLTTVTPGIEGSFLDIQRDGEKLKLFVEPELRPWGLYTSWTATEETDAFFTFTPR